MGAHKNRLSEAILMSTHNIGFYENLAKIIFQLSSNIHRIYSSDSSKTVALWPTTALGKLSSTLNCGLFQSHFVPLQLFISDAV